MKVYISKEPKTIEYAMEAVKQTGIEPTLMSIRGGTDGSILSAKGLPTPNLFDGGHNFHSPKEWVALGAMEKGVEMLINLVQLWAKD